MFDERYVLPVNLKSDPFGTYRNKMLKNKEEQEQCLVLQKGEMAGINMPVVIFVPKNCKTNKPILVFNNDDGNTTEKSVENIKQSMPAIIGRNDINSPVIVPILPSMIEFNEKLKQHDINMTVGDSKQFAAEIFDENIPADFEYHRLDNQVKKIQEFLCSDSEMSEKVQTHFGNRLKMPFSEKFTGFGHSGAGAALLRYSAICPEYFDKIIVGGNNDILPVMVGEKASLFNYPLGTKDYEKLFGHAYPIAPYENIDFNIYIGENESTVATYDTIRDDNYAEGGTGCNFCPEHAAEAYKDAFGHNADDRFRNVLDEYVNNGLSVRLKIYKNDCHTPIQKEDLQNLLYGDGSAFPVRNPRKSIYEEAGKIDRSAAIANDLNADIGIVY